MVAGLSDAGLTALVRGGLSRGFNMAPRRTSSRLFCGTDILALLSVVGRHEDRFGGTATRRRTGAICCLDVRFLVNHSFGGGLCGVSLSRAVRGTLSGFNMGLSGLCRLRPSTNLNGNNLNELTTYFLSTLSDNNCPTVNCYVGCRLNVFHRGLISN